MPLAPGATVASLVFWNLIAAGMVSGLFTMFWMAVCRVRRPTPGLNAALAFAALVCTEAAILNILSVFGGIGKPGVLIGHLVLIGLASRAVGVWSGRPALPWRRRIPAWGWVLTAVAAMVAASALRYAPNTGDAMTYHLARVAHWIQNGSVAPYPSLSLRQTIMMPGAEYLVTSLLTVAGSDHLAALPQFAAWVIVAGAAPSLARLCGAPLRWAWLAAPAVASSPMLVLQASSTQNDLVAAATAVAVVAASLPLLHRGRPPISSALIVFGFACAAAGLVKATAVVAATPFAIAAVVTVLRAGLPRLRIPALMVAVLTMALLVVPEAARRQTLTRAASNDFVYAMSDGVGDRLSNQRRAIAHHLTTPFAIERPTPSQPGALPRNMPSRAHEDFAGNALQFVMIAGLFGLAVWRWKRIPRRAQLAAGCWLVGWVAIHGIMKDNEFLSRLQVPWFALLPVLFGVTSGLRPSRGAAASVLTVLTSGILVGNGLWTAARNELRPPLARTGPRETHYFMNGSLAFSQQRQALSLARSAGCARLALFMGESGFDYPITRAAMAGGMATRHLLADDGWACAIYVEHLSWGRWNLARPQVALDARAWSVGAIGPGGPFVYLRNRGSPKP